MESGYRVAVIQRPPVMCDREGTLERAVASVNEAADAGARLIVFPETWIPGYPDWVWRTTPNNYAVNGPLFTLLQANSIDLDADGLAPLREAARRRSVTIVGGINEIDGRFGRTTLYNTLVTIGPGGDVLNRHRKLMPTNPERMVWGIGDGSGLRVIDTPSGRVGGLICWENYMPLARFAIYAQGVEIYIASTWDEGEGWFASLRHIAREGRCWVIGSSNCFQVKDLPAALPGRNEVYPDDEMWVNSGGSTIVDPNGKVVAGPMLEQTGVLYANCDPGVARAARRTLDVAGHYGRADVFQLHVDREIHAPAEFSSNGYDPKSTAPA